MDGDEKNSLDKQKEMILENPEIWFPHDGVREGQAELIQDIKTALDQEKTILAHAPTGLGKTASALSVAVPLAQKLKKKVFFLTNRHTQHAIAIDTLKAMHEKFDKLIIVSDIIGKRGMCSQEVAKLFGSDFNEFCKSLVEKGNCSYYSKVRGKKGVTIDAEYVIAKIRAAKPMHTEELQLAASREGMCSYEIAFEIAKKADVIVGDYYYLFNPSIRKNILKKLDIELKDIILVVDEAHNLHNRVTEMQSSKLTQNVLKYAAQEAQKQGAEGLANILLDIQAKFANLKPLSEKVREAKVREEDFVAIIKTNIDYEQFIEDLESVADELREQQKKSFCGSVAEFLRRWPGKNKGFARIFRETQGKIGSYKELEYLCLDPSVASRDIFTELHSAVVMSGTLRPLPMYADLLGVKSAIQKEYWSPFPLENKRAIVVPKTSTKYTSRSDAMYAQMGKLISEYVRAIPGNVAVFFPSYYM